MASRGEQNYREPPLLDSSPGRSPAPAEPQTSTDAHPRRRGRREDLAILLLRRAKLSADRHSNFWSFEILSQILTRERMSRALEIKFNGKEKFTHISFYLDQIGPIYDDDADITRKGSFHCPPPGPKRYLRVFGILVMINMVKHIDHFIKSNIGDDDLPLLHLQKFFEYSDSDEEGDTDSDKDGGDEEPLYFFREWDGVKIDDFDHKQWQFLTPFFSRKDRINHSENTVIHYKLSQETILPWIKVWSDTARGAFSTVQRVTVDPGSHDFHMQDDSISISDFAIKSMVKGREEDFAREVNVLERFASSAVSHIVPLLCTFEQNGIIHMIFPWAECNLYEYWSSNPDWFIKADASGQRWISGQLLGLADALDTIHNSHDELGDRFGRHGDIKPDNILWLQSKKEPQGSFLLSDLGLATLHRASTHERRSRTKTFGFTATYRPPEIDIADVKLSRSLDIWSLGCVFLEMACWLLGGFKEVENLSSLRTLGSVGIDSNAFFSAKPSQKGKGYDFIVKQQVTEHITLLHRHKNCTMFIHDLLDLIQDNMLLINGAERIRSGELLDRLKQMHRRAIDDDEKDYILKPCPIERPERAIPVREAKVDLDVRELLLKETRAQMTQRFSLRINGSRRSIRVREKSTTTSIGPILLPWVTTSELHGPREFSTDNIASEGAGLGATTASRGRPLSFVPPTLNSRYSADDYSLPLEDTDSFMHNIDTIVRKSFSPSEADVEVYEVAFDITWQLQQCIRDELDGSADLGPILTVTGNSLHAWATSCHEYVRTTWKVADSGEQFLMDLEVFLGKRFTTSDQQPISRLKGTLCSIDEEASGTSRVIFQGTVTEISILGQFLSWTAASFRMPRSDQVTSSYVDFRDVSKHNSNLQTYRISLRDLRSLDDRPGTCWKALFPSTVMACGFPVPVCPGTSGLRISFDAMLEMAEILYDVNLEDDDSNDAGVYFDGISYMLYSTAYIQDHNTIQWHLESKYKQPEDRERDHALAPDSGAGPKWKRISDLNTLRSATAILGYCSEVQIQLGTAARVQYHGRLRASLSHLERPPPEVSGGSVGGGFSIMGFLNGSGSASIKPRNGLKRAKELGREADYMQVLRTAEKESVILQDTKPGNERAWMVSKLSLILELFNIWAFKSEIKDIKYAKSGPDGGAEARAILAEKAYAKRVVVEKILESESNKQIGDIIKGIYGQIQQCMKENAGSDAGAHGVTRLGRSGMVGWDWLELIDMSSTIDNRREVGRHLGQQQRRRGRNSRAATSTNGSLTSLNSQPCWTPFTRVVPVFFGQGMGELIIPTQPTAVCRQWYPMPGGLDILYLAASVHCIRSLAAHFGHIDPWFFFDDLVWLYKDQRVFQPCDACLANARDCFKQPQVLAEVKGKIWKERPGPSPAAPILQVKDDGAVVFALKRKTMNI